MLVSQTVLDPNRSRFNFNFSSNFIDKTAVSVASSGLSNLLLVDQLFGVIPGDDPPPRRVTPNTAWGRLGLGHDPPPSRVTPNTAWGCLGLGNKIHAMFNSLYSLVLARSIRN